MSINSVNGYDNSLAYTATQIASVVTKEEETKAAEVKAEEQGNKEDTFEKSMTYKMDMEKVDSMKAELSNNVAAFKMMVQGLFQKQGGQYDFAANDAMQALMEIDEATQLAAQEAISEDGEWGVNAVSTRIFDFAKALTGGDPSKIEAMRSAVESGFAAAEEVWGGKLPDISYQTKEKVMQGFDDWAAESGVAATVAAE